MPVIVRHPTSSAQAFSASRSSSNATAFPGPNTHHAPRSRPSDPFQYRNEWRGHAHETTAVVVVDQAEVMLHRGPRLDPPRDDGPPSSQRGWP